MENFEIIKQLEDLLEITNEKQRQNISDLLKEIERKGKDDARNEECNLPVVSGCASLEEIEQAVDKLTSDERLELIGRYCNGCGSLDNTCQCWNDE